MPARVLMNLASAAQTITANAWNGPDLDSGDVQAIVVDINLTALTGGASPTAKFVIDRKGEDGIYYDTGWAPVAISAAGTFSGSIGLGGPAAGAVGANQGLGNTIRLRAITTGAPTSITFSASIRNV